MQAAGVEFVIVRAGYGQGHEDSKFKDYATEALNRGFKVGAYWFSYALDVDQARKEGEYCRDIIGNWGGLLELPVFFDQEYSSWRENNSWDSDSATAMCDAFADALNLNTGVYANYDWFTNILDYEYLKGKYSIWLAQYDSSPTLECDIWQYSDSEQYGANQLDSNISYMEA